MTSGLKVLKQGVVKVAVAIPFDDIRLCFIRANFLFTTKILIIPLMCFRRINKSPDLAGREMITGIYKQGFVNI